MKNVLLIIGCILAAMAVAACGRSCGKKSCQKKQEMEIIKEAVRNRSSDVQKVEVIGNNVVYTRINDGIIDVTTYVYEGNECIRVERVYTYPDQASALRHYKRAMAKADVYDKVEQFNNKVKYEIKKGQHELETKGLTPDQLKAKFDKQIQDMKSGIKDVQSDIRKAQSDVKEGGKQIKSEIKQTQEKVKSDLKK